MIEGSPLVWAARGYNGVKFRHRGRSQYSLDCAGLLIRAYADCGVELPDIPFYGPEPFKNGLVEHMVRCAGAPVKVAPVRAGDLQDSDIAVFRFHKHPHHLGMIASTNYGGVLAWNIIHADGEIGRVLEQRLTPDMIARITHLFRRPV